MRRCLDGKQLAFIGDSLTRYQYLALAHTLAHLAAPERYGGVDGSPSICNEKEWADDWSGFYDGSSRCEAERLTCVMCKEWDDWSDFYDGSSRCDTCVMEVTRKRPNRVQISYCLCQ
jgi:hypothetical protein